VGRRTQDHQAIRFLTQHRARGVRCFTDLTRIGSATRIEDLVGARRRSAIHECAARRLHLRLAGGLAGRLDHADHAQRLATSPGARRQQQEPDHQNRPHAAILMELMSLHSLDG
jgi:hypothetical protein